MADQDLGTNPYRELARRVLITLVLGVLVYRLGMQIPVPGVNVVAITAALKESGSGIAGMAVAWLQMMNGQGLSQGSIFALGIMPYISASIIFQLLTFSVPALKALQKDGETGRRKINQYTRYATLLIAIVQAVIISISLSNMGPQGVNKDIPVITMESKLLFVVQASLVITTSCMLILWIAEQITKFGIGNGVSVVIMVGILASLPAVFASMPQELPPYLLLISVTMLIIAAVVIVVMAIRKIHLEQQRRVQGNKVYGGGQTSLPLKLNQANVIPVIFAQPVAMVLGYALAAFGTAAALDQLMQYGQPLHRYVMASLIIGFTFFYISITFDLNDLSNNFKQSGFFIRGVKPGKNTVDYLSFVLKRITVVGACSLALIATLPEIIASLFEVHMGSRGAILLFGGTGLMIVVGVTIDIMQKIATFFLAQQYQGLSAGPTKPKNGKRF